MLWRHRHQRRRQADRTAPQASLSVRGRVPAIAESVQSRSAGRRHRRGAPADRDAAIWHDSRSRDRLMHSPASGTDQAYLNLAIQYEAPTIFGNTR